MYKLAKMRERMSGDLGHIRCIKSQVTEHLVKDDKLKEMCSYFHKLYNENHIGELYQKQIVKLVVGTIDVFGKVVLLQLRFP